jgi:hypothetical protein
MEAAICTRCQSSNPVFTKFCLTCGLEITAAMKRVINVSASGVQTNIPLASGNSQPEPAAVSTAPVNNSQPQPQKEGTGWLKGLRLFGR